MAVIEQIQEEPPRKAGPSAAPKDEPSINMAGWGNQATPGQRDLEETLKSFDNHPLFMRDLPTDGQGDSSDPNSQAALEALQALAFDGTPDEVAKNFKEQGNENFIAKRYREALGFYTQAIDANPTDDKIKESLHANRAACHLELSNFGSCLRDTSATIAINPKNVKAYYRAAKALLALDKTDEAIDCCDHALQFDASNEPIKAVRKKAQDRKDHLLKVKQEREERERRKKEGETALKQAFLARGLWLEASPRPPDNPHPAHFDPESLSAFSSSSLPLSSKWVAPDVVRTPLILPTFFIYPQHAQSDLISHFHEDTPIAVHLDTMFPPEARGSLPWDIKGEYVSSNLQVYVTTQKLRLLKVGRKLSLREVMDQASTEGKRPQDRDGMVMRDGVVSLVVLPKGEAEQKWIASYKKQREESQAKK